MVENRTKRNQTRPLSFVYPCIIKLQSNSPSLLPSSLSASPFREDLNFKDNQQLMSCFSLAKKLLPAKKAWKSFSHTLQSKLYKLKNSKPIKKTTRRLIALRSIRHPLVSRAHDRPFSTLPRNHRHHHHPPNYYHHQQELQKRFMTIYVDEFFAETLSVSPGETSEAKEMNAANGALSNAKPKADAAEMSLQQQQPMPTVGIKVFDEKARQRKSKEIKKSIYDVEDAWKAAVASSPQLRGVDERAEEFISKFREEMKLQKEKSLLDFQEMLARSAS